MLNHLAQLPRPSLDLTEGDCEIVRKTLEQLKSEGRATPDAFLTAAEPEDSPLHKFFEWDNDRAAHEHRLLQARQLVRTVVLRPVRVETTRKTISVRINPSVREEDEDDERPEPRLPLPTPIPETQVTRGKIKELADRIEDALKDARGTMDIFDEMRTLREILADLRQKAPWEGKRCPKCSLLGHAPGSRFCTPVNQCLGRKAID